MSKLSLSIQNLCTTNEHKFNEKKTPTRIKQVSTKNKNTSAKFSKETKGAIIIRDKQCIICGKPITDIHHVFFGTECEYGDNRNDINKGVGLCREHHDLVHGCKQGEGIRQFCIDYLKQIYE